MTAIASLLLFAISIGLIFLIRFFFVKQYYPKKTGKMLDSLDQLDEIGLKRDENGYNGNYRSYPVYVYATTSIKRIGYFQGDKFQIWVIIAPEPGQLKGLGGFFGKYLVAGQKPGYAMIGFLVNYNTTASPEERIKFKLDTLVDDLEGNGIRPYII